MTSCLRVVFQKRRKKLTTAQLKILFVQKNKKIFQNKFMKKVLLIIFALMVVVFGIFFIRGEEDTWLCDKEKGEWVKHGVPSAPMPTESCGNEIVCEKYGVDGCPEKCVVCPPCVECSSISCQTESFCESIGFDKDWYKNIKENMPLIFHKEIHSIANNSKECSMAGILTDDYFYNKDTKTWWIDLERIPELEKDGCNPACVVDEKTKTADVYWRCQGVLPPETECEEDQRNVDACIEIYQPVCATVNIQCITTPCDPVEEAFSNSCFACQNPLVSSYKEGECK